MICQHNGGASGKRSLVVYPLLCAFTSIAFALGVSSLPASADADHRKTKRTPHASRTHRGGDATDPGGGDSIHDGNGSKNRNIVSVRSPTNNRGYQHTSAETMGGTTSIQNALCRHAKVCNITLKVIVITPDKAKKSKAKTVKKAATPPQDEVETLGTDDTCDECCECEPDGSK
ncbi:hypothetical protein GCM10022226_71040 [Sphaerisporangium flaviroseum]|uniref:Secreted protein n=2 Tax=Sphaerisporangium flaviroseum TaxID=509199 RepID=A0ABP7JB24_9ACTN